MNSRNHLRRIPEPSGLVPDVPHRHEIHRIKSGSTLGAGNHDGIVNPGETVPLLLDGTAYRAGEMFTFDPCVQTSPANAMVGPYVTSRLSDSWSSYDNVGASVKDSLPIISSACPPGHQITFFMRYQLPHRPEHILKEGVATVVVGGSVQPPPPVLAWVTGNVVQVDLRGRTGVASATAIFQSKHRPTLKIPLNDEGRDADRAAGDGVFSGLIVNPRPGTYTLSVSIRDVLGKSTTVTVSGSFQLPQP